MFYNTNDNVLKNGRKFSVRKTNLALTTPPKNVFLNLKNEFPIFKKIFITYTDLSFPERIPFGHQQNLTKNDKGIKD